MFLLSGDKRDLYVSTNGGTNWHSHSLPGVVQDFMLSSVNKAHMVLVTGEKKVWNEIV